MADFDETLNGILNNPAAMEQIARLAQSLNTGNPVPSGAGNSVPPSMERETNAVPERETNAVPPEAAETPALPPRQSAETEMLKRLLPLVRELGVQRDSNARRLLYALRPYLPPARQEKVERALQLARFYQIAKRFLSQQGNQRKEQREGEKNDV